MTKLMRAARKFDALPVAPANVAKFMIHRHHRHREQVAASDPTWAAIEARRVVPGSSSTVFLSADDDLAIHHWATQERIEAELVPDPWWMPLAARMLHAELGSLVGTVRRRRQRAGRGWADSDVWGLGHHLARTLGEMLTFMAGNLGGWPGTKEFPTPDLWAAALAEHGTALCVYGNETGSGELLDAWSVLANDPDADPDELEVASVAMHDAEDARLVAAQDALRWVAEHLGSLWD